jgi:hypothetical protein
MHPVVVGSGIIVKFLLAHFLGDNFLRMRTAESG